MEKIFALRRKIKSKFQNCELIFGGWVSYPEVSITVLRCQNLLLSKHRIVLYTDVCSCTFKTLTK